MLIGVLVSNLSALGKHFHNGEYILPKDLFILCKINRVVKNYMQIDVCKTRDY